MWRWQSSRSAVVGAAIVVFVVCCVLPVGYLLTVSLSSVDAFSALLLDARQRQLLYNTALLGTGTALRGLNELRMPAREHVLEEALEKLDAGARHSAQVLGPVVPIAEGDPSPALPWVRPIPPGPLSAKLERGDFNSW